MPLEYVNKASENGSPSAVFREVNSRIREVAERFGDGQPSTYICECDDSACLAPVSMTLGEYDAARRLTSSGALLAHDLTDHGSSRGQS